TSKKEDEKEEEIPEPTKEEVLLGEIRDLLKQQNSSKDRA
ncbi:large conductance mechanosensitive channel protein MscL, partial [Bacillus thuringiensis]